MTNNRDRSPAAAVGVSFRLPGARGESLWEALLTGRDLVSSVDPDRWSQDSLLHPNKGEPGTSYTFAAGSIGDVSGFDAGFFGISPREAEQMDPQQRLLLEMVRIMGDSSIQHDCVIGAGAFVRRIFDQAGVVLAGVLAKVIRENVTWDHRDLAPQTLPENKVSTEPQKEY